MDQLRMHVRAEAVPSRRQNGRNQLFSLTILRDEGEQPLSFPSFALAVPKKASVLVGLKAAARLA
jgi:hypothetical protein